MNSWVIKGTLFVALLGMTFGAGWFARNPSATKTEIKETEQEVVKIVTEREVRPDGVIKETVTETRLVNTKTNSNKPTEPVIKEVRKTWSASAYWYPADLYHEQYRPAGMGVGYRLWADLWADGGFMFDPGRAYIGVRYEF